MKPKYEKKDTDKKKKDKDDKTAIFKNSLYKNNRVFIGGGMGHDQDKP